LHFEKTKVKCCGASDRLQTNFVPQFSYILLLWH
jgi:hypothetical protein